MASSSDYHIGSGPVSPRASNDEARCEENLRQVLLPPKEEYRDEPNTPRDPYSPPPYHRRAAPAFISRAIQVLPWMVISFILAWLASGMYFQVRTFKTDIRVLTFDGDQEIEVQQDTLPEEPTPVMMEVADGHTRWTVSIPSWLEFPLLPQEYGDLCTAIHHMSEHLDEKKSTVAHHPYYYVDEKFMDVPEAEDAGLLPTNPITKWSTVGSSTYDSSDPKADAAGYCKRSLTFNLETTDAGLGNTLMQLWMAYGLAQKEDRAFFIDDRNWAYGSYSTYFQPPPDPGCLAPPDSHKLPCPHHAAHLVVSRGTQFMVFGHDFNEQFEDPRKMAVQRQREMFGMLRMGYEDLFKLSDADQSKVDARVAEIHEQVRERGGVEIGVHVRHGDNHPWEVQFQNDYVPLSRFIDVAWQLAEAAHNASVHLQRDAGDFANLDASRMILASDDPDVFWGSTMALAMPAQDLIRLGEDTLLEEDKGTEDSSPWQGGFTVKKFWALGQSGREDSDIDESGTRLVPARTTMKLRERVGKAYLMDLAILSQTDRVVCTVSSIGCRLLAVMLGWDRAIEKEQWHNVDGDWFWKGIRW